MVHPPVGFYSLFSGMARQGASCRCADGLLRDVFPDVLISSITPRARTVMTFIGRNTFPLLLFSPLFTILAKFYQPYLLRQEPSGILFLVVSVSIATAGSLAIAWGFDKLRISPWFFGREKSIVF